MRFSVSLRQWLSKVYGRPHRIGLMAVFLLVVGIGLLGPVHVTQANVVTEYANAGLTTLITWIALIINSLTEMVGRMLLLLIEMLIVPILQYNGFSTSQTIDLGWSLVRDVVNMFVVIVLLVIALATIVGYGKITWQQALPQFLLAVILVNFSRTICGFLIDVSQIVMFTFVNALLDVAAGNFAQLLGIQDYGQYSNQAIVNTENGQTVANPITAAEQLGAAYMLFVLYIAMFSIILLLGLVFIWRIIVLWILIIMSPLTFFFGGIKSMFSFAAGAHGEWWKKFVAALTIGPMLTFFLWLALAAASKGSITTTENFPIPENPSAYMLVTFELDKLLSVFLGLVLLVVGMQQAASSANALGSQAGALINDKMGQKIVGGIFKGAGAGAVGHTLARGGVEVGRRTSIGAIGVGKELGKMSSGPIGFLTNPLARSIVNTAGFAQQKAEGFQKSGTDASKKRIGAMTNEQKAAHLEMMAAGRTGSININTIDDMNAIKQDFALNGNARKEAKKVLSASQYDTFALDADKYLETKKDSLDDGEKAKRLKFKSEIAHLLSPADLEALVQDAKFNPGELSKESLESAAVREALKRKVIKTNDDGTKAITAYDEMDRGAYKSELRDALRAGSVPKVYDKASAAGDGTKGTVDSGTFTVKEIAGNIIAKRINVGSVSADEFTHPVNGNSFTQAMLQTEQKPDVINNPTARTEYVDTARRLANTRGALTPKQAAFIDTLDLEDGRSVTDVFDAGRTGAIDVGRAARAIKRNPELAANFRAAGGTHLESAQDAVVEALNAKQVEDLVSKHAASTDPAEVARITAAIDAMSRAIEGHVSRNVGPRTKLADHDEELSGAYKRLRRAASLVGVTPPPAHI